MRRAEVVLTVIPMILHIMYIRQVYAYATQPQPYIAVLLQWWSIAQLPHESMLYMSYLMNCICMHFDNTGAHEGIVPINHMLHVLRQHLTVQTV